MQISVDSWAPEVMHSLRVVLPLIYVVSYAGGGVGGVQI